MNQPTASEKKRFEALAKRWHSATDYLSSPTQIAADPNYLAIIAMGESVVPLILSDLRKRGGEWYRALTAIARSVGIDPPTLRPSDLANSRKVDQAWLQWGQQHGYTTLGHRPRERRG